MTLETKRLILRPFKESDAEAVYKYASDPRVGPAAGWPVHTSVENSREIIKHVLCKKGIYAIVLKNDDKPVGCAGLMPAATGKKNEREIGYWIGVPYWGQGLVPEAVRELERHGFIDLGLNLIWCAYYDGNEKSLRVQQKCGFTYHHTEYNKQCSMLDEIRTEHYTCITKKQWLEFAESAE